MVKNCCFCVDPKTATIALAGSGAVYHGVNVFRVYQGLGPMFVYNLFALYACLFGVLGVVKSDPKGLRFYVYYFWVTSVLDLLAEALSVSQLFSDKYRFCDMMQQSKRSLFESMEDCIAWYPYMMLSVIVLFTLRGYIQFHLATVVQGHYRRVRRVQEGAAPKLPVFNEQVGQQSTTV